MKAKPYRDPVVVVVGELEAYSCATSGKARRWRLGHDFEPARAGLETKLLVQIEAGQFAGIADVKFLIGVSGEVPVFPANLNSAQLGIFGGRGRN
jgi:hypothetical protein